MNVAHNEIDLTNPKTNKKNAGFTQVLFLFYVCHTFISKVPKKVSLRFSLFNLQEERDGMTDFLEDGYVDSFRELYPDERDVFTFWSYMSKARSRNIGW